MGTYAESLPRNVGVGSNPLLLLCPDYNIFDLFLRGKTVSRLALSRRHLYNEAIKLTAEVDYCGYAGTNEAAGALRVSLL